jgi:uncharacterized protein (DUF1501 family)
VDGVSGPTKTNLRQAYAALGQGSVTSAAMGQARAAVRDSAQVHSQLEAFAGFSSPVPYPSDALGSKLAALAALLATGMPVRCVTLQGTYGYDTHAAQAKSFAPNFEAVAESLLAFQRDLEARGLADRVLVEVWSEFGRRPAENGSGGTDHGAGGLAFVMGTNASGAMVGEFPGLAQLDTLSNLRATSDYRGLYCALLEQWLGVDAAPIIPGADGFEQPQLLKA